MNYKMSGASRATECPDWATTGREDGLVVTQVSSSSSRGSMFSVRW